MNDNTILRIKVPAHLYESVKAQLTLKESKNRLSEAISGTDEELMAFYEKVKQMEAEGTDLESAIQYALFDIENPDAAKELSSMNEAKKGGHNYGSGMEVVKEKKMKTSTDGMKKVEKEVKDNKKKSHSLEELKDAHKKLSGKIEEMENTSINKADDQQASVEEIAAAMDKAVAFAKKLAQQIANKKGGSLTQKDFFRLIDNFRSKVKDFGPFKRD
jgi:hypothetical protein